MVKKNNGSLLKGMNANGWAVMITSLLGFTLTTVDGQFFSMVYPLIQKDLHLGNWVIGVIVTVMGILSCLSVLIGGPLIDYVGRKKIFQWTILMTALGSALTAVSGGFWSLLIARGITTGGNTAEWMCGQIMVAEGTPAVGRGFWIGIAQMGWPLGTFLSAAVVMALEPMWGWRGVFWAGLVPIFLILVARLFIKESDRYTEVANLRKAAKQESLDKAASEGNYAVNAEEAVQFTYKQLFLPDMRKTTILFFIWQFLYNYGLFCVSYFVPFIAQANGFTITDSWSITFWSSLMGAAGYFSSGYFGNRYGRKLVCILWLAIGSIAGMLMAFASTSVGMMTLWYGLFWFFTVGHMGAFVGFCLESFPTRARGTGGSLCSFGTWFGLVMAGATSQIIVAAIGVKFATFIWLGLLPWVAVFCCAGQRNIPPGMDLEEIIV